MEEFNPGYQPTLRRDVLAHLRNMSQDTKEPLSR